MSEIEYPATGVKAAFSLSYQLSAPAFPLRFRRLQIRVRDVKLKADG